MKYPPEKFYGLRGYSEEQNAAWMSKQLNKDLSGKFLPAVALNDVFLMVDRSSAKGLNSGRPDYLLYHKDSNGLFRPMTLEGKQVRWAPDPQAEISRLNGERKRQAQKELEKARQLKTAALASKPKPFNLIGK